MNPFTRFLKQWSPNQSLEEFVSHWDVIEMVTIQVYREKMSQEEAQSHFETSWPWMRKNYKKWADELRPFWEKTKAAGETTKLDPFQMLIDFQTPADIIGDWTAMQHLPAAREALNQYILHIGK